MTNYLRGRWESLAEAFWLRPALLVLAGILLGETAIWIERAGFAALLPPQGWIYAGGASGAQSLLGAVASSTIGVAGTTFSITVAALTLASGQMGPRLLRSFVRDAGNQFALGIFLGTFAYALIVLRTVRSPEQGDFVPHLAVTGAVALALLCVATLTWFVHHVASGINVETVIATVNDDLRTALRRLTVAEPPPPVQVPDTLGARAIDGVEAGYLRVLDEDGLADWAAASGAILVLRVRPGDFVFPGTPIAYVVGPAPREGNDADDRVQAALSVGPRQAAAQDLEFSARQLVEIAVRALSPGINDPFTAIAVLDHLGGVLCDLRGRQLPAAAILRDGRAVLFRRATDYDGLCDTMFHMIRQNASGAAPVLIRLLEVLGAVLEAEHDAARRATLLRHAALTLAAGRQGLSEVSALADLTARHLSLPRN